MYNILIYSFAFVLLLSNAFASEDVRFLWGGKVPENDLKVELKQVRNEVSNFDTVIVNGEKYVIYMSVL